MMPKIGVVLDDRNQITSLMKATKVEIYEKFTSEWNKDCEVIKCLRTRNSMNEMREFTQELIAELRDCKILVASILTGIPYMILDNAGFMICEAEEFNEQLLEEIAFDYEKSKEEIKQAEKVNLDYPTKPYETSEAGIFELDLRKLQAIHPDISSKKALIPFLKEVKFYQLKVFCSHVMPWLERELSTLGCGYRVVRLEGEGYQVQIEKLCCNKNIT